MVTSDSDSDVETLQNVRSTDFDSDLGVTDSKFREMVSPGEYIRLSLGNLFVSPFRRCTFWGETVFQSTLIELCHQF